ncbi:MBOAT family protein [Lachnospiraceae bacterium]|nr:MBOAT family protein [Lachnospiraceae bacterium]
MVFSSIPFLFFFLPICLILYYLVSYRWKNSVLLFFSLVFYAWGEPVYILLMFFATAVDYCSGRLMERFGKKEGMRKLFLVFSVTVNLSVLAFFKYADFLIGTVNGLLSASIKPLGLGLPVGISFFTFQTMSYSIDLYRRKVPMERNYLDYLTYVSMFPQLVAGPIVRYSVVNQELRNREIKKEEIQEGLFRFMQGLFKKVLIANQAGALWEEIRALEAGGASVATAWLGALSFTLQLYFDFSAYSDMAIGMGRMLGFQFPENFNYPLSSVSVTDFWRRWHISLSSWFRDYVYIPLGGNRKGTPRHLRNMLIVWFLTGLWHGAAWNFVLWGLYYGILLILEKYVWGKTLERLPKICGHIYAVLIVVVGFVIFVFDDMGALGRYFLSMAGCAGNTWWGEEFLWYLFNYKAVLIVAAVLAFPVYPWFKRKVELAGDGIRTGVSVLAMAGYVVLFLVTVAFLVNDTFNPFLYFRF